MSMPPPPPPPPPRPGTPVLATALSSHRFGKLPAVVNIGGTLAKRNFPTGQKDLLFWYVVVDLATLAVVEDVASASNSTVPASVQAYAKKDGYFLFFVAVRQGSSTLPQGALHAFLKGVGAGGALEDLEQIVEQIGTGMVTQYSYVLAATLDDGDLPGYEAVSTDTDSVLPMQFLPVTMGGKTMHIPSRRA